MHVSRLTRFQTICMIQHKHLLVGMAGTVGAANLVNDGERRSLCSLVVPFHISDAPGTFVTGIIIVAAHCECSE